MENTVSQVKNCSWNYSVYSLPEESFLFSEFGRVFTNIHSYMTLLSQRLPRIWQVEGKHCINDDRESKVNVIKLYILSRQHNSYIIKYSNWVWKRKQKVNVRLIILWPDGDS